VVLFCLVILVLCGENVCGVVFCVGFVVFDGSFGLLV
jgi:hypothetical protein